MKDEIIKAYATCRDTKAKLKDLEPEYLKLVAEYQRAQRAYDNILYRWNPETDEIGKPDAF